MTIPVSQTEYWIHLFKLKKLKPELLSFDSIKKINKFILMSCTLAKCGKIFGDRGQTFAPFDIPYLRQL